MLMKNNNLSGLTLLNTRPALQAEALALRIEQAGGCCVNIPGVEILPLMVDESQIKQWASADLWLFMSQYAVMYGWPLLKSFSASAIGAVGKETAVALIKQGASVTYVSQGNASSEALLAELTTLPQKITIFRGTSGRSFLDDALKKHGVIIQDALLYERVLPRWTQEQLQLLENPEINMGLGLSVDSLRYFFEALTASSQAHQKTRLLNMPWLIMSQRVADYAKTLGIKKIHIINNTDIIGSLHHAFS